MDNIVIHAKFAPDGTCLEISDKPDWATPHQWYTLLCKRGPYNFQPFMGGRGTFSVPATELGSLQAPIQ